MPNPRYSIIIPVYNRPQEVAELLASLTNQSYKNFEVLIVEDGSTQRCDEVVDLYRDILSIQYFFKPNSGPGPSRNYGYENAKGEYFIVFDSDCIIPPDYLRIVEDYLFAKELDAWGGPDRASDDFTPIQRAMGYTMSSVLTTGGIRGSKKRMGWFQPRSFNMGISRKVFEKTGGFNFTHLAEDIEFSIRIKKAGFKIGLIADAFVYHKRRADLSSFYHQVYNFGRGRVMVGRVFPDEVKLTHWFPTIFVAGIFLMLLLIPFAPMLSLLLAVGYLSYFALIFSHSYQNNKSLRIAAVSIPAAFLQLWGYGNGFLKEWLKSYMTPKVIN